MKGHNKQNCPANELGVPAWTGAIGQFHDAYIRDQIDNGVDTAVGKLDDQVRDEFKCLYACHSQGVVPWEVNEQFST